MSVASTARRSEYWAGPPVGVESAVGRRVTTTSVVAVVHRSAAQASTTGFTVPGNA